MRGVLRRTGPRGVSLRATGAWGLPQAWACWREGGLDAVHDLIQTVPAGFMGGQDAAAPDTEAIAGAAASRASRPVVARPPTPGSSDSAGGMGGDARRVLVHVSGFRQSPYADIKPAGVSGRDARKLAEEAGSAQAPRRLWHSSQGSSGR